MQTLTYILPLIPALAGLAAFLIRSDRLRRALLLMTAAAHVSMTVAAWRSPPLLDTANRWLLLDDTGLLFLSITSGLFFVTALYTVGYLARERLSVHQDMQEGFLFTNEPETVFTGCLLLFLASMTLVTECQRFGLLWVAIEATTLASAPLIYFHRQHRSLEATWKYLLICSVGIALALLGNFLLAISASAAGGEHGPLPLIVGTMIEHAGSLDKMWLRAAFLFLLVGYGTKMGLAPMHTWLPDAHSESPSAVSALLSGALLNCAFLGILRAHQVCVAAGEGVFSRELLLVFGLLSMGVSAIFILGQNDFKRMLAYSSVEHMGILSLGFGLGGGAVFGSLLHAVNHSVTKAMLFLVAGNILAAFNTKNSREIRGLQQILPLTGLLWIMGFLAITGSPPFGVFLSEFTILKAGVDQGRTLVVVLYLALLVLVFIGMATTVLKMSQGRSETRPLRPRETWSMVVPPALLAVLVVLFGLYIPAGMTNVLRDAARTFGGI